MMVLIPLGVNAEWVTMQCSAYCDYGTTASGSYTHEGIVASDDLPIGTVVYINGIRYEVQDRFGGGYTNRLDIYMENYDDAVNFGVQMISVYVDR